MWFRFFIILVVLIVSSCQSGDSQPEDIIVNKWRLITKDGEKVETNEGLQFAPNKQYFRMDSQGKAIPKLMEKIWTINNDTLIFVDYNYEQKFIHTKGTTKFLINSLTKDVLEITTIGKGDHHYIYKPFNDEDN
jgi:prolyl oligopeptidase PreP (S9A serine peptidase family)